MTTKVKVLEGDNIILLRIENNSFASFTKDYPGAVASAEQAPRMDGWVKNGDLWGSPKCK